MNGQPPPRQSSVPPPMDQLQGTMNMLYTLLGSALKPPVKLRDPQHRMQLQPAFHSANFRLQDALDRMETEINTARAILRRDLALHRVLEEEKKEQITVAEKEVKKDPAGQQVVKRAEDEDVVMLDDMSSAVPRAQAEVDGSPEKTSEPFKRDNSPSKDMSQGAAATAPIAPAKSEARADAPAPTKSPTVNGSAAGDLDFSSMFGDEVLTNPDGTNEDTNMDFGDGSADVSSLLPGLESYANQPDEDNAMPDVTSSLAAAAAADQPAENQMPEFNLPDLPPVEDLPPPTEGDAQLAGDDVGETNFEDFTFDLDDLGGGADAAGGQETDNTFNDLFDIDDYNPDIPDGKAGQDLEDWMSSLN